MVPGVGSLLPTWETWIESWLLALATPNSGNCGHLGSEPTEIQSFSVSQATRAPTQENGFLVCFVLFFNYKPGGITVA